MQNENTATLYRNPFDDYNANVLAPDLIMRYWCTPFNMGSLKDFNESKFFREKMPIILQGSRGSGKTTILKYFSFPVQCERALRSNISIVSQLCKDGGVGFYLRCDDSFLNMFKVVFKNSVEDAWLKCFDHYMELFFVKNIIDMLEFVKNNAEVKVDNIIEKLDFKACGISEEICDLSDLKNIIVKEIAYINRFKNNALFTKETFQPKNILEFYQISGELIEAIHKNIIEFRDINFILLIDEFENLPIELQKMFNTMIKFSKTGMSLRIGRRSESDSIISKETINDSEYLREANDYQLIILDDLFTEPKKYRKYLLDIASKRLQLFEGLKIPKDITCIIGDKEDLDRECLDLTKDKVQHLEYILDGNRFLSKNRKLKEKIIDIILYPRNAIAESLCALWVAREKDNSMFLKTAENAAGAMKAYLENGEAELKEKFQGDYSNKYRYALTNVICAAYRKSKLYYGFNTVCYLSDGNTRVFINLCKTIINDALFYEKKSFLDNGTISVKSQDRAIHEYALAEFNSVCSIIKDGNSIKNLILQIGNVLIDYAKDRKVRYPETTQFTYELDNLNEINKEILDTAESWALIKRKKGTHRLSAGIREEGYLYSLNRVFVPIFGISYRTRGGVNIKFTDKDISAMLLGESVSKLNEADNLKNKSKSIDSKKDDNRQIPLWSDIK